MLEGVRCRNSREDSAFTLEGVAEQKVFSNGHVDLQLFFDVDTETKAHVVIGSAIGQGVRAEEIAVFAADALTASITCVHIALGIEDRLLTAYANHEPVPPDVTFDTEGDHTADVGTLVPMGVIFALGIIDRFTSFIIVVPVVSLQLVPDEVCAHPEEATVKSDVDTETGLSMLVLDTRSLHQLHREGGHQFAIQGIQSKERAGLGQEGEVAVVEGPKRRR